MSPEGKVLPGATFGGPSAGASNKEDPPDFDDAISADGRRVYWSSLEDEKPVGLYVRENPGEPQSPIVNGRCSVSTDACTSLVSSGEAQYWASAANGRYAVYTEGQGLYRFNAEPKEGGVSREILAGPSAGVVGVLGVSADGDSVYFVAKGVLAGASGEGAEPVEGEPNLYLWHDGAAPVFIGTLSRADGSKVQPFYGSLFDKKKLITVIGRLVWVPVRLESPVMVAVWCSCQVNRWVRLVIRMGMRLVVTRYMCTRPRPIACIVRRVGLCVKVHRDICQSAGTTALFPNGSVKMAIAYSLIALPHLCRKPRMVGRMCMSGSAKGSVVAGTVPV